MWTFNSHVSIKTQMKAKSMEAAVDGTSELDVYRSGKGSLTSGVATRLGRRTPLIKIGVVSVAVLSLGLHGLAAQTTTWTSEADGLWQDAGNWSNGAPLSGDAVTINNAGPKTVTIDVTTPLANLGIGALTVSGSGNVLNLANAGSTLVVSGGVSVDTDASLQISGGNLDTRIAPYAWIQSGVSSMSAGTWLAGSETRIGTSAFSLGKLNMTGGFIDTSSVRIAGFGNSIGELTMTDGYFKGGFVDIGITGNYAGHGTVDVSGNAILETLGLYVVQSSGIGAGATSLKVHSGGTLQFSTNDAYITTADGATVTLENGVISYRGVANAEIDRAVVEAGITFAGNNAFRLNNSSNAVVSEYTFNAGLGGHNYQGLQLTGAASRWQSTGTTTIGAAGELRVFDATSASIDADVVSSGAISVTNSNVTWEKGVSLSGKYTSALATNTFRANLNVTATGAISGDAGTIFEFRGDFINHSTNAIEFNLVSSEVRFIETGSHTFDLTGSGAMDLGGVGFSAENFGIGILGIATDNNLVLTGVAGTNALYVGVLNLAGWDTSSGALELTLTTALDLSDGINIYYDSSLLENAYLNGATYDLWDGQGKLIAAVPEPGTLVLLILGGTLGLLLRLRRNRIAATAV